LCCTPRFALRDTAWWVASHGLLGGGGAEQAGTAWPDGECLATEKIGGSSGPAITIRGDPNGWWSVAGTALLRARYSQTGVPEGVTWLFEIVLPEDRVVVDYGDRRDLVRLSAIYIATGRDVDLWRVAGP